MSEYDNNEFDVDPEQVAESLDADAKPLCMDCLQECNELSYYCEHCNAFSPINPLAAYMPFVRLRMVCGFYITAWRRMWCDQDISGTFRILLALFICIAIPYLAVIALLFLLFCKDSLPGTSNKLKPLPAITMILFMIALVLLRLLPYILHAVSGCMNYY